MTASTSNYGPRLRALRKAARYSMGELSRAAQIPVAGISLVERGERPPFPISRTKNILDILEITDPDERWSLIWPGIRERGLQIPSLLKAMGESRIREVADSLWGLGVGDPTLKEEQG